MTSAPEYSNRNYLALENANKQAKLVFCIRRGCVRMQDVPNSTAQIAVPTGPCASAASISQQQRTPATAVAVWVVQTGCGSDRDCLPSLSYWNNRAAADLSAAGFLRSFPRRTATVRPLRPGEQISY